MAGAASFDQPFSIARYWQAGDSVSHAIAALLLAMSLACWCVILARALGSWRTRAGAAAVARFWDAPSVHDGIALLALADRDALFFPLPASALAHAGGAATLGGQLGRADQLTRVLRQQIGHATRRMEGGLTLLASIGATAPFVGLLGTVWGIYHALTKVAAAGVLRVDQLAGPVGEALIMTGCGLVVAIPAVLAYNGFNRMNRVAQAELDGFARDLHAYFCR